MTYYTDTYLNTEYDVIILDDTTCLWRVIFWDRLFHWSKLKVFVYSKLSCWSSKPSGLYLQVVFSTGVTVLVISSCFPTKLNCIFCSVYFYIKILINLVSYSLRCSSAWLIQSSWSVLIENKMSWCDATNNQIIWTILFLPVANKWTNWYFI